MSTRLAKNKKCPLHNSYFCCGRVRREVSEKTHHSGIVRRVEDSTNPRGYREICSPAELRRRKDKLLADDPICWLCGGMIVDYRDADLEHKESKGMNGSKRDDAWPNLALAHRGCNFSKGSMGVDQWRAYRKEKGLPYL